MPDVFISHHSADRDAVAIIAEELAKLKLDVWFDRELQSGSAYDSQITQQLETAKAVLTCWTPAAIKSDWVRSEAEIARNANKLVPCLLAPTALTPPFNLVQAEDLSSWAGQEDNHNWLKILEQLGQLTDRPGLATFRAVMRPTATLPELKAWVTANAADPLSAEVWHRVGELEGENADQKAARETAEVQARERIRKAQAKRSRDLAKARGLRDPERERRRWMLLFASVVLIAAVIVGWISYSIDLGERTSRLDRLDGARDLGAFIAANWFHLPVRYAAEEKLRRLDERDWAEAKQDRRKSKLQNYIETYSGLSGQHLIEAQRAMAIADRVSTVQQDMRRLGLYRGPAEGALDATTSNAIARFRLRTGMTVSDRVDDDLMKELGRAIEWWIHPAPAELRASALDAPTEDDIIALAKGLEVDLPSLLAVYEVEGGGRGFDAEGRPLIVFEPGTFQGHIKDAYDPTGYPVLDATPGGEGELQGRWAQLEAAFVLNPEAAYEATSFGGFQINGLNAKRMGFPSAGEYARFVSQSELNQLGALFLFASKSSILDTLKARDWDGFARLYYGSGPGASKYAERIAAAYKRQAAIFSARPPWEAATLPSGSPRAPNTPPQ